MSFRTDLIKKTQCQTPKKSSLLSPDTGQIIQQWSKNKHLTDIHDVVGSER